MIIIPKIFILPVTYDANQTWYKFYSIRSYNRIRGRIAKDIIKNKDIVIILR